MIRYAAISSSGKRFKSDSRDEVDSWCADRVREGAASAQIAKIPYDLAEHIARVYYP